ncbi:MAG: TlpA disulfide reductase family protein [Leptospira sp.]|nr:TlpA disulfide reductase family protein [Leptospira sp.]
MKLLSKSLILFIFSLSLNFCDLNSNDPKVSLSSISLKSMDANNSVRLTEFKGKVVIVDFWATWCEPCSKAVPVLNAWKKQTNSKEIVFIGINTDQGEELAKIQNHAKDLKMEYESLLDPEWYLSELYGIEGIPCLLVFDKEGKIIFRQYGLNASDLPGLIIRSNVWIQH